MKLIQPQSLSALSFILLPLHISLCQAEQSLTTVASAVGFAQYDKRNQPSLLHQQQNSSFSDQETLRLMWQGQSNVGISWDLHYMAYHQQPKQNISTQGFEHIFRYHAVKQIVKQSTNHALIHGLDRAVLTLDYKNFRLYFGRQPISFGAGRFWQPTDVFGAFNPTELDREYKPGVDATVIDFYPSEFSKLTLAYVFTNKTNTELSDSYAAQFRRSIGESSEITLIAGKVIAQNVLGGSFESNIGAIAYRLEELVYQEPSSKRYENIIIAGLDYQFDNEVIVSSEYYYNSNGAHTPQQLFASATSLLSLTGLQKQLGKRVAGLALTKQLSALFSGSYAMFIANLRDDAGYDFSALHQASLSYSLADESDLLLALLWPRK
ncbi:MAG: hypothetical protein OEZ58_08270, partial [Gammaproteobacteria bacterium]|nr:hypothetical protein [Gammaproteobacteria bacterium]